MTSWSRQCIGCSEKKRGRRQGILVAMAVGHILAGATRTLGATLLPLLLVLDSMQGMTTLKAFNASTRRGQELQAEAGTLYRATMAQQAILLLGNGIASWARNGYEHRAAIGVGALHAPASFEPFGFDANLSRFFLS